MLLSCERGVSLLLKDNRSYENLPKERVKNRRNSRGAETHRLPTVSSRSAFTPVGIAGLCARMITAKVETEKPQFLRAFGVPEGRGFCPWVLTHPCPPYSQETETSNTGPHLLSQLSQRKTCHKFLCKSNAFTMKW